MLTTALFVPTVTGSANGLRPQSDMTYLKTSQRSPYPNLDHLKHLNILVNIHKNRVFIRSGNQVVYTMYCSAGMTDPKTKHSDTPTGHFTIQNERGDHFYNQNLHEGANNWTSFKDHGVYLFHSVPTDAHGNYKLTEASKLGKQPGSHGCIRLSVPDSLWIKDNVPTGTLVTIKE